MRISRRSSGPNTDSAKSTQLNFECDVGPELPLEELAALIEAFLLVAEEPPTIEELAAGASTRSENIEAALAYMADRVDRGWLVQRHGDRIQLATAPRFAPYLRAFLGLDREARLSSAALETLAIVAYQQPATRSEIETVRGVDCSGVLATLHARGLIEPISRRPTVGSPIQYGTSADFLNHFGLSSLADLPPIGLIDGIEGRRVLENASMSGSSDQTLAESMTHDDQVSPEEAPENGGES